MAIPEEDKFFRNQAILYGLGSVWWTGFAVYWLFIATGVTHPRAAALGCLANIFFSIQGLRRYHRSWLNERRTRGE